MSAKRGVGIDVGSNFLKIAEVRSRKGRYFLTDLFSLKIGSSEINGREAVLEDQLQDIIQRRLSDSSLRRGTIGISGKGILHRYIHIPPVPAWKVKMMVEFEVNSGGFTDDDISYDTSLLSLPKGLSGEYTVLTSMARSGHVRELLENLKKAGIRADCVLPSPLASFNAYIADISRIKDKTVLVADIGAYNTELAILRENKLYFVRTLPVGGKAFTEAIQEELDLKPEQAEEMKKEKGKILLGDSGENDNEQAVRLSDALKRAAVHISSQIQASVRFAADNIHLESLEIDEFYISGGGARVKGLLRFWQSLLGKSVQILNPLKSLDLSPLPPQRMSEVAELPSGYTTAIGLAVSSFSDQMVSMNLLPEQEKSRIAFFHKKLPLYISLTLLFITSLLFTVFNIRFSGEINDIEDNIRIISSGIDSQKKKFSKAAVGTEKVLQKYRFITSRVAESRFLLEIIDCFNEVRPRQVWLKKAVTSRDPDSGNVKALLAVYAKESETQTAHRVFEQFKKSMEERETVSSISVDNIEDYSDTGKKMIIVSFTVHSFPQSNGS